LLIVIVVINENVIDECKEYEKMNNSLIYNEFIIRIIYSLNRNIKNIEIINLISIIIII
jgi:hypothetical protein